MSPNPHQKLPLFYMGITGSFAGSVAELLTIPLDTAKVRMQLQTTQSGVAPKYKGSLGTVATIIKEEGLFAPWGGWGPGVQRQIIFAFLRIGLYEPVRNLVTPKNRIDSPSLLSKIAAGLLTGSFGILVASPTDVIKIRMQAQGRPGATKIYSGVFDAYAKIFKNQGLGGFYAGLGPNMARNAIINAGELATFDQVKQVVIQKGWMKDGILCHFFCSAIAGFMATVVGSPVDVIKTRVINSTAKDGVIRTVANIVKNEGFGAFYKGFGANANRIISWNIAMFVVLEQSRSYVSKHLNGNGKKNRQL